MLRLAFPRNGGKLVQRASVKAFPPIAGARCSQFLAHQSQRNASSMTTLQRFFNISKINRAKELKKAVDNSPRNLEVTLSYLRAENEIDPQKVFTFIEKGWQNGTMPVNDEFGREFFKAAAALKILDRVSVFDIVALQAKHAAGANGPTPLADAQVARLLQNVGTMGGGGGGGAAAGGGINFAVGGSHQQPLYVTSSKTKAQYAYELAKYGIFLFFLLSLYSSFVDDSKGSGGGLASKLGMGSVVHVAEKSDKTFADVVGIDEAKADLEEIVMYLKDSKKFTRLGGKLPKGILLTGAPGTGKTLLARSIAGEAKVPFFYCSGSEFEEMFVGVGAKRVRDLFAEAKQKSPSIIFIDEIDAIGGKREMKDQSAMRQTLNQLLTEMDGFEQNTGVIVIAATNFPGSLDSALVRPGRFDKHVEVPMPDIGGRKAILELYGKKVPLDKDVNMEQIARGTPGFSGAELFNLINQAALKASVDNLNKVSMAALEYAKDKIMMGAERKSAIISPETMKLTAYHEAGHALVALRTAGANPIHKATIMPRGRALGMVMQLPDGDQTSMSRKQMLAMLDVCMGGRVAEELIFGYDNVTSGASSDIQQATRIAKAMVTQYGLSEKVGMQFIDEKAKQSGETSAQVDQEVKDLLNASYARTKALLDTHRKELEIVAKGLLEYESLAGGEIVDLINGKSITGVRSQKPSRATQALPTARGATPALASVTAPKAPTTAGNTATAANKTAATSAANTQQKTAVDKDATVKK